MRNALIIAASPEQEIGYIRAVYEQMDTPAVFCADGGLQKANRLSIPCDVLMGDMDSGGGEGAGRVVYFPAEKDYSDTEACVIEAMDQGYTTLVAVGATGGRLDHLLCNLHLMELVGQRGGNLVLVDATNVVQLLRNGVVRVPCEYRYFSISPIDPVLTGVEISGAKYPLQNATVRRDHASLTVSNEAPNGEVTIRVAQGKAFLIFSK